MLFSFSYLKQLAKLPNNFTIEKMQDSLNQLGFEVEKYWQLAKLKGLKFAKLIKIFPNPKADNLLICHVQLANGEIKIVQTSAKNVLGQENKYVMLFVPGGHLNQIKFSQKIIRGYPSQGMMASFVDLGFKPKLLPNSWTQGVHIFANIDLHQDPINFFDLDDYILKLKILPNRSDANCYFILAQELSALINQSKISFPKPQKAHFRSQLQVKNGQARLLAFVETKLTKLKTTIFETILLLKSEIKLQSAIVNLTNLTLLMTGQPIHVYDKAKIANMLTSSLGNIKAKVLGDKVVDFKNALLIKDQKQFVSAASNIGFAKTSITDGSTTAIIEIGQFVPWQVKKTSQQIKISSLASIQGSKSLSFGTAELAWNYLSNKLTHFSNLVNFPKVKPKEIKFDYLELEKIANQQFSQVTYQEIFKQLECLGFKIKTKVWILPSYRHDLKDQQDLNEEFLRFYGYQNFNETRPNILPFVCQKFTNWNAFLTTMGYQETWTYSLVAQEDNWLNPFQFSKQIKLQTTVSNNFAVIRNSLVTSLLKVFLNNAKQKITKMSIFDIGYINNGVQTLAIATNCKTFQTIKRDLVNLLQLPINFTKFQNPKVHPNLSCQIKFDKIMIGWIGKLNPLLVNHFVSDIYFAEINLNLLPKTKLKKIITYSQTQMHSRDITFNLELQQSIASKLDKLASKNFFSIQTIDQFVTGDIKKITIRIIGEQDKIAWLDKELKNW